MSKKVPSIVKQIQKHTLPSQEGFKTVSFSQMQTYYTCPFRWDLQYRQKVLPFENSIFLVFGTSLHELFQHYLTLMYTQSAKVADQLDAQQFLLERLSENYKTSVQESGKHYTTPQQLQEFYEDGVEIFNWFKRKRTTYFSSRGTQLVGVEIPILTPVTPQHPNILYKGFIDLVMYDESTQKFTIYDIKTSTRGWTDREKKDEVKVSQVLLYKSYFSQQFNVSEDQIDVEFFIVKRKLLDNCDFPQKRVQEFKPTQGTAKVRKATTLLQTFVEECFDSQGVPLEKAHHKNVGEYSCKFCPCLDRPDLCNKQN